ncbi:MAG: glycosyltransferase family protein [Candidatus Woesearchaeota archaeon]
MARIWYSVQGDGFGHALRSSIVLDYLIKHHTVVITAAGRAYPYLKKKFPTNTFFLEGVTFVYKNNAISYPATLMHFFSGRIQGSKKNHVLIKTLLKKYQPTLVVSDFEPYACYYAKYHRLPCIALDNVHLLVNTVLEIPRTKKMRAFFAKAFIRMLFPKATHYLIPTFYPLPVSNQTTTLLPAFVRQSLSSYKVTNNDYLLVYQTTPTNTALLDVLFSFPATFKIYGMKQKGKKANCFFYGFDEHQFLAHLAGCKAVIVNGGFNVIAEAFYYQKPVLAVPIKNQFEQWYNGYLLKKAGYGDVVETLSAPQLANFLSAYDQYAKVLSAYKKPSLPAVYRTIETVIRNYA